MDSNLNDPDYLFFAERKTHRAFLCQTEHDAVRLFVEGFPAIAPIDGKWRLGYNSVFHQAGKTEIWILGEKEWAIDTRQRFFDVAGQLKAKIVPVENSWEHSAKGLAKLAWELINKKKEEPKPISDFSINGAANIPLKKNRYGAVDLSDALQEVHYG